MVALNKGGPIHRGMVQVSSETLCYNPRTMAQLLAGTICEGLELRPKIMQNVVAEKWTEDRGDKARALESLQTCKGR